MRLRHALIALGVLAVLAIASVFAVPPLVRAQVDRALATVFTEPPSLGRIRFNPLTFTVTAERFRLPARGDSVVAFDRLAIGFDVFSPFRGAWTFRAVELDRPVLRLALAQGRTLNLAQLLRPQPAAADTSPADPPRLLLRNVVVRGGSVAWRDETRSPAFTTRLDSLDISLRDFRTEKRADNEYRLEARTAAGEGLAWRGSFTLAPFTSRGRIRIDRLRAATLDALLAGTLPFRFGGGEADLGASYRLDGGATPPSFGLDSLVTEVRGLALIDTVADTTVLSLARGATRGGRVDPAAPRIDLGAADVEGLKVAMWLEPDGHLNLERWGRRPPDAPPDTAAPWVVTATVMAASGLDLTFEDHRLSSPSRFAISHGHGTVRGFSTAPGAAFELALACSTGAGGSARGEGTMTANPPSADVKLDVGGFDLRALQPYVDVFARLDLQRGVVDGAGRLRFNSFGAAGPLLRFEGDATSRDLSTRDRDLGQDFVHWSRLRLRGLEADVMPARVRIREIEAVRPYLRAVVAPDRTTNFQQVLTPASAPPAAFAGAAADTPEVRIERITIRDGSAWFADLSLQPNFATGIQDLAGTITGLSSLRQTGGEVALEGKVERYAPVRIGGRIDPFGGAGRSEVAVDFRHIELTTFTPYAGKFAGYRIRKGKLNLHLSYEVAGKKLKGENKVFLEQLTLGERVDSPDATRLPVRFAIALLKDKDGNIDLDIPVKGDLDDPKFSLGRVIVKVLVNLLARAVSSPFKLLGALAGGGEEDLEGIEFEPGRTALSEDATARLGHLAKALTDRPALRLEIEVAPDAARDSAALARQRFEETLAAVMTPEERGMAAAASRLPPAAYAAVVERAYVKAFGPLPREKTKRGRGAAADSAALAAEAVRLAGMEQRLRLSVRVTAEEIAALARARALAIKDQLMRVAAIGEERLFLVTRASPAWRAEEAGIELDDADAAADSAAAAAPRPRDETSVRVRLSLTGD